VCNRRRIGENESAPIGAIVFRRCKRNREYSQAIGGCGDSARQGVNRNAVEGPIHLADIQRPNLFLVKNNTQSRRSGGQ
jgi:hypothetical protein